jgi:hypothetical protein
MLEEIETAIRIRSIEISDNMGGHYRFASTWLSIEPVMRDRTGIYIFPTLVLLLCGKPKTRTFDLALFKSRQIMFR